MTDRTSDRAHGRMPSDEQMDGLLRDFFRLETPLELARPWQRPSAAATSETSLILTPAVTAAVPVTGRRMTVFAALAALVLTLVVFVQNDKPAGLNGSPVVNAPEGPAVPAAASEDLMLVSPEGDLKASSTIGADGVTLEETEGVELSPRQHR